MMITTSGARAAIRSTPAGWLANALERRGIPLAVANTALGFQESTLQQQQEAMPLEVYFRLFEWAARELKDPLLGVHIAMESSPREYGLLGYLSSNGATLRDNLRFVERYHDVFSPEFSFQFTESADTTWCTYSEADLPGVNSVQDIIFSLGLALKTIRAYTADSWQPLQCFFTFREPDDVTPYHDFFGNNLVFDHPANRFEFETALLDSPTDNADPSLVPILLNQANQLLDDIRGDQDLVEKLRLLIVASLGTETINTTRAAERLNMSVRSLHRHLGLKHTSFKQVREEVIIKVAKEALVETGLSITEISSRLNYSETSAFDRVFKRLTGSTPRQYRQQSSAQV